MKILVFAHVPPPHHGQSYMVKLMLDGFGGDHRNVPAGPGSPYDIQCYHVNARLSRHLEDIGDVRLGKICLLVWYCLQAVWCRFRHGVKTLYYVPAPGKTSALVRDWIVMTLCRPFFSRIILHWHAAGMARWLETSKKPVFRALTRQSLGRADLCVVLSSFNYKDAEILSPQRIRIIGDGIPDPCPDFGTGLLLRRRARLAAREKIVSGQTLSDAEQREAGPHPHRFNVLYLAHCTREKGLFDTLEGVAIAAARLNAVHSPVQIELTVAGEFMNAAEEAEFQARIKLPDLQGTDGRPMVQYVGFVGAGRKRQAFEAADCFCFPTYYYAESFGLVLVEAMAFGIPIITSRWRSVPELLPPDYDALVNPRSPHEVAEKLLGIIASQSGEGMRQRFVDNYHADIHLARLAEAMHSVENATATATEQPPASTKVLVFAHTPPPHHGQSYMIKLMLEGFGGDQRDPKNHPTDLGIACYHVNARLSRDLEDVGEARLGKLGVLFWCCLEAIWCRIRYRPAVFYYVPAPGKRAALWRDWIVMILCRPFYRHVVFHWHAAGLGQWLKTSAGPATRTITRLTMSKPSLSIIISDFNRTDAEALASRKICRVNYGIPDPCPDFDTTLLSERAARAMVVQQLLTAPPTTEGAEATFTVLFLANCLRTKGLFDALEAFIQLRERLHGEGRALRLRLEVGGAFGDAEDQRLFEERIAESDAASEIEYLGFVSGAQKNEALRTADLLCFPTYYPGENQPIVLVESLAYGLPAVTTSWRSIPDIFPPQYPGIVPPQNVAALADAMWRMMKFNNSQQLRAHFLEHFTMQTHLQKLAAAIHGLE